MLYKALLTAILLAFLSACASAPVSPEPLPADRAGVETLHERLVAEHGPNWRDWPAADRARLQAALYHLHRDVASED